jgi:hypothetical protein
MTFVFKHRVSTIHGWAKLQTGRRVAARLRRRLNLTPQERANLYVSRTPIAVITASLGGHPIDTERNRSQSRARDTLHNNSFRVPV